MNRYRILLSWATVVLLILSGCSASQPVSNGPTPELPEAEATPPLAIFALEADDDITSLDDAVFVRVLDIGPGLACVMRLPGDYYVVYDAGHWAGGGSRTFAGIQAVVPDGEEIDLMVLSHSDSDHLAAVDEILDSYTVKTVLRGGLFNDRTTWKTADAAIDSAIAAGTTTEINLGDTPLLPGSTFRFGETFLTFVTGFHEPPEDWDIQDGSEHRNAGSIVIRLLYRGRSILFTGDAVGRHNGQPDDAPAIATEGYMLTNAPAVPIQSDVLIAPHHGADNGSSWAFIKAVAPHFVIFSAGHDHEHPRAAAAMRYLDLGIPTSRIFRTDLGDDEGDPEWDFGRNAGSTDPVGDDDVNIIISSTGEVLVTYQLGN